MTPVRRALPSTLLRQEITGHHVPAGATVESLLAEVGGDATVLVAFLRHHG